MTRRRVTEIVKLPMGTPRFSQVTPVLHNAFLAKKAAGKVTSAIPVVVEHGDGYYTTTSVFTWISAEEYEAFKQFHIANFKTAQDAYYLAVHEGHDDNLLGTRLLQIRVDEIPD